MRTPSRLPRCGTQARAVHPGQAEPDFRGWNNKFRAPPSLGLRSGARECSRVGAPVVASDHFGAAEPTIGPCGGVGAAVFCSGPIGAELIVSMRSVNRLGFISAEAQQ